MSDEQQPNDGPFAENESDRWAKRFQIGVPIAATFMGKWGGFLAGTVGPILGELFAKTVPNQRLDRMARYLGKVQKAFPEEKLEQIAADNEKVALIEEGMYAASFSTQKSRTDRIASIVVDGLSKEQLDLDRSTHLLSLVRTLTDFDVILLHRYKLVGANDRQALLAFDETHAELFPRHPRTSSREDIEAARMRQSLLRSHMNTLIAAGLLEEEGEIRLPAIPRSLSDRTADSTIANFVKEVVTKIIDRRYKVSSLGNELIDALSATEADSPGDESERRAYGSS